jgi:hypothetical protein
MRLIIKEYDYALYEDENNELWIEVLCGSIGMYEVLVKLNPDEIIQYKKDKSFLQNLAWNISRDPEKFINR